jgi:hypothetical protein
VRLLAEHSEEATQPSFFGNPATCLRQQIRGFAPRAHARFALVGKLPRYAANAISKDVATCDPRAKSRYLKASHGIEGVVVCLVLDIQDAAGSRR